MEDFAEEENKWKTSLKRLGYEMNWIFVDMHG
jgi:hypothetical protein